MLQRVLFFAYINNIDDTLRGIISKFATGTKIVRVVNIEDESPMLKVDLVGFVRRKEQW